MRSTVSEPGRALRAHLKAHFKKAGLTYADLARRLGVAEITIKKWMTTRDIRHENLVRICQVTGLSPYSLIEGDFIGAGVGREYPPHVEELFASEPAAFFIFIKLLFGHSKEKIQELLGASENEFLKQLRRLENAGLILHLPGDRVRLRLRGPFRWRSDGPLGKRFFSLMRESLYDHFRKYRMTMDRPSANAWALFRPFEFYLDELSAAQFSKELSELLFKYRTVSHQSRGANSPVKPVAGLIALDEFDLWHDVLIRRAR